MVTLEEVKEEVKYSKKLSNHGKGSSKGSGRVIQINEVNINMNQESAIRNSDLNSNIILHPINVDSSNQNAKPSNP